MKSGKLTSARNSLLRIARSWEKVELLPNEETLLSEIRLLGQRVGILAAEEIRREAAMLVDTVCPFCGGLAVLGYKGNPARGKCGGCSKVFRLVRRRTP